jgi:hypothetical protein
LANKDSDLVSAATSATQGHNAKATELRRDKTRGWDGLGEPHVHLWGSVVHHLSEHGRLSQDEKDVKQHLIDATLKDLEGKVLVARCKKCYDPRKMRFVLRVCFAADAGPVLQFVVKAIFADGAVLKTGCRATNWQ